RHLTSSNRLVLTTVRTFYVGIALSGRKNDSIISLIGGERIARNDINPSTESAQSDGPRIQIQRSSDMKSQRLAIGLTVINLLLLIFLLAQIRRTRASEVAPVLRGRGLEIVDAQGRVRAAILVHGPQVAC